MSISDTNLAATALRWAGAPTPDYDGSLLGPNKNMYELADRLESGESIIVPRSVWDAHGQLSREAECFRYRCGHNHLTGCLTGCEASYTAHECPWEGIEVALERLAESKKGAGLT